MKLPLFPRPSLAAALALLAASPLFALEVTTNQVFQVTPGGAW